MTQSDMVRSDTVPDKIETACINTIRMLAVDAVEQARSGHPGMPMGAAPMAYVLWTKFLRKNPADPKWFNRDRFVLSAGHGSMLLYAVLYLSGYDLTLDEIRAFRQWNSLTPGHPEYDLTPGVETTTGPLGQGFANGVGMAIAERHLAARFNRPGHEVVDHHTYGIVSDGDLMEGISHEAASLAGHLGLGKLVYLWDDNRMTIDGSTRLTFTEDVRGRFESYGWQVLQVEDGNDTLAIEKALVSAHECEDKPTLIGVRTTIGYGSPNKADTADVHGAPLGAGEVLATKQALNWPEQFPFCVPAEVRKHMNSTEAGTQMQLQWEADMDLYRTAYPDVALEFDAFLHGELPENWIEFLPEFAPDAAMATRAASGKVLGGILDAVPSMIGGSADLTGSNKTRGGRQHDFQEDLPSGSYLRFGVREHGMAAICSGIALHGGLRPYCGTFLVFSDYMRPAIRLSAIMRLPVIFVFTHDSIGTGEDGPTHQGVEQVMSLRAIPNLVVIRPADANETKQAWQVALQRSGGPTALILTRQGVPMVSGPSGGLDRGAYVLVEESGPDLDLILIGTGSELQYAVEAAGILAAEGISVRVVSMPSWELFAEQPAAYRSEVLPSTASRRVAIEAGVSLGWERYVGAEGTFVGMDRFGASAPGKVLFEKFGFTASRVLSEARVLLSA